MYQSVVAGGKHPIELSGDVGDSTRLRDASMTNTLTGSSTPALPQESFSVASSWRERVASWKKDWRTILFSIIFFTVTLVIPPLLLGLLPHQFLFVVKWIHSQGFLGIIYFILLMTVWIVCCMPTTPVELASGFLFGFWRSLIISLIGKTMGSLFAFLFGRFVFHKLVHENIMRKYKIMKAFKLALDQRPYSTLLLIRVAVVPIAIKNYGLSILPVQIHHYLICSLIGGIPFTLAWSYFGSASMDLVQIFSGSDAAKSPARRNAEISLLIMGLVATVLVLWMIRFYTQRALKKFHEDHPNDSETDEKPENEIDHNLRKVAVASGQDSFDRNALKSEEPIIQVSAHQVPV
jgi:uncharacterized membrane protein YdjX (TVP38/TMEM64 family)